MNQQTGHKFEDENNKLEIMDESNAPEIKDEELDRVSGGGNSAWGTVTREPSKYHKI